MVLISQNKKREILQKILASSEFAGSKSHQALLTYLVESSIKGKILKETTIALEVLGRNSNFNSNEDTIVRVHVHNLRTKLEAYYNNEGKNDKVKVEIPKGHYAANFVFVPPVLIHKFKNSARFLNKGLIALLSLLIVMLFLLYYQNRKMNNRLRVQNNSIDINDIIWSKYLQSDLPILLVLGDHYFFAEFNNKLGKWRYIRDFSINSEIDFENFKTQHPDFLLDAARTQYFPGGSIWALPDILSALKSSKQKAYLRSSSNIAVDDLQDYNIVFLGNIKTLGILDHYLHNSEISYHLNPSELLYKQTKYDTTFIYKTQGNPSRYHSDVAIVLKCSGPRNNKIIIITSFFMSGTTEAVKYLTQPALLQQIENNFRKQYGFVPEDFIIIFTVKGFSTSGFYTSISKMIKLTAFNPWK